MKQTFEITEGCTRVTLEQHEDKVLTIFESKRFEEKDLLRYETIVTNNIHGVCVEFKEEEPEARFKDGDILNYEGRIFIFSGKYGNHTQVGIIDKCLYLFPYIGFHETDKATFATESEKQLLFDALAKFGKKWNAEKKCIEDLKHDRWRAKIYEPYYVLDDFFEVCESEENNDKIDNKRYNAGNYFKTEQQCKDFAEQIKQLPR